MKFLSIQTPFIGFRIFAYEGFVFTFGVLTSVDKIRQFGMIGDKRINALNDLLMDSRADGTANQKVTHRVA